MSARITAKQRNISDKSLANLLPHQFKKGQSGNPTGRPKGSSMKVWAQNYLASLTEEERLEFVEGMNKIDIWKMGEGNPKQDTEVKGNLTISQVLDELENGSTSEEQNLEIEPPLQDQEQSREVNQV